MLAYRSPQLARLETPRIEALPNFAKIELQELNRAEAERLFTEEPHVGGRSGQPRASDERAQQPGRGGE